EQWNAARPALERSAALAEQIANQQIAQSRTADARATDQWNYNKGTFQPTEQQTVRDAFGAQYLSPADQARLQQASQEETDHLAWTLQRLEELRDRPSLLNPLWYAGAFAIGFAAGKLGDPVSLGFVVETERQVEAHLEGHLERLPAQDSASRAIVEQMKADEIAHAEMALRAGAVELPGPVKGLMSMAARVMTTVAHRI
ncbi:MAG: 2-polyprenyl-3-methyl-6-methoxy-1,4-benzoquinone monooxygenase, partial [Rhodoferax sp.]|nr:2-polyprenyl-3-methyl-6-methoxy-1,4-benzoquinone monooxygenase [Rhodoferax sp.]